MPHQRPPFRVLQLGILALALMMSWPGLTAAEGPAAERVVRFLYLVPKDRQEQRDYRQAIEKAAVSVREWYAGQTGGYTFRLHLPVVEVARTSHTAAWYNEHEKGKDQRLWTWYNAADDARQLFGATWSNTPRAIYVVYVDAAGGTGAGTPGIAVLPEHDLLGLVGRHPKEKKLERWFGGLGHELGHCFNLAHPGEAQAQALMQFGYIIYPKTYFTPADLKLLAGSGFFFDASGKPWMEKGVAAHYSYAGGAFFKLGGQWREVKAKTGETYRFREERAEGGDLLLRDDTRKMRIKLPLAGGKATFATDGKPDWSPLYEVKNEGMPQ